MSEPIYTYKRGAGWILGPAFKTATVRDDLRGRTVTAELRPPAIGEYGWFFDRDWSLERALNDVIDNGFEFEFANDDKYGWKHDGKTRNVLSKLGNLLIMTVFS